MLERPIHIASAKETPNVTALTASRAWVTTYDGAGGIEDITTVSCGDNPGYQTNLSDYLGAVVDNYIYSYVLNWRPYELGDYMQLCGLRVAYRLPLEGGGFDPYFSYFHVGGSSLRPRDSNAEWDSDGSGGCLYLTAGNPNNVFNIHMDIPNGSRIDYLRIYCYRDQSMVYIPFVMK
jgi:hypothetical protein